MLLLRGYNTAFLELNLFTYTLVTYTNHLSFAFAKKKSLLARGLTSDFSNLNDLHLHKQYPNINFKNVG